MYRHAVAVFTATSAVLLASAVQASAENETAARCGNFDAISINVSPPAPLTGTITGEDIRSLMDTIVADSRLRGFFSPGAGVPAIPEIPYIAPVPVRYAPISGPFAPPAQPDVPLSGADVPPAQAEFQAEVPPAPVDAPVTDPYAPIQGGPTPSTSTSASAAPSTSQSGLPRPSQAPSTSQSSSVTPSGSALSTGSDPSSPMRVMFEDLIGRALTCARSTAAPDAELPPMPVIDAPSVARYLERAVSTAPAACTPATGPATGEFRQSVSLLEVLGVRVILDGLTPNPAACALPESQAGTTAQAGSPPSLLNALGVTRLLTNLFDND